MQTVETLNEGLKRAFRITIPAKEIDALVDKELKTIAPQVRMPGFRPGKVPANLVRKMHGPQLEQQALEIGSGRLIPGFEDQLIGAKANDQLVVSVTFPDAYPVDYLKGRPATFDVVVNEVQIARPVKADDEFAKSMGMEGIDQLRELMKGQIEQELNGLTRT